jgi:pimeloyl-ACP methyl ester carboxylesterase
MRTIILFERGINGWASLFGDWLNWPNQAITWVHKNTDYRAHTLLYFTSALFAGWTRPHRALQFSKLIRQYSVDDWRIILVAHSEGTATAIQAMRLAGWPRIESVHLVCGACDSNFERNGLNYALVTNKIGKVFCYTAEKDFAMRLEDTMLGLLMFGISWNDCPLGMSGPKNVRPRFLDEGRVTEKHWPAYGHSDCWLSDNFESTMRQFIPTSG